MPKKRNKTKKELNKKTKESSKETPNKQTSSQLGDGVGCSNTQSSLPQSMSDSNNPSASCSHTLILPTNTILNPTLHTDKEKETENASISEAPVNPDIQKDTTLTSSKDVKPEVSKELSEKKDSDSRPLKQMLLSPKGDSDALKTKRKNKNMSSKRNRKEEKSKQSNIPEYFVVRRSQRKVKSKIEEEKQESIEEAVLEGIEEGIEVRNVEGKGRGVFAVKAFQRGDFVCEYHGEHIDYDTAKKREKKYSEDEHIGCYMYYFSFKNKKYCVDATQESGRLGRLLNHSMNGNCTTKLISIKDKPYLILVAAKDIQPGSELLYDYGERNKDAIASHPWLQA